MNSVFYCFLKFSFSFFFLVWKLVAKIKSCDFKLIVFKENLNREG